MWTATFVLEIAKFRVFEPFVAELDAQVPSINMSALVDWTELGWRTRCCMFLPSTRRKF